MSTRYELMIDDYLRRRTDWRIIFGRKLKTRRRDKAIAAVNFAGSLCGFIALAILIL